VEALYCLWIKSAAQEVFVTEGDRCPDGSRACKGHQIGYGKPIRPLLEHAKNGSSNDACGAHDRDSVSVSHCKNLSIS